MSCNCCNYRKTRATSIVATPDGTDTILTITVPSTVDLTSMGCVDVIIATAIPQSARCCRVSVTNGTQTLNVLKDDGNYWRPCELRCRSILRMRLLTDPIHLLIRGVSK